MVHKPSKNAKDGTTRRDFLKIASAGAAGAMLAGFPVLSKAEPKEILIGQIHPLTGGLAQTGQAYKTGVEIAVEEINKKGGIKSLGGAKLKLLNGDSQGKPQVGVAEAERLIKEGVVATFGCYQSSVSFAVSQINEKYQTPFLITLAISEKILQRGFKYTFRCSADSIIGVRQVVEAIKKLGDDTGIPMKRIATIHEDTLFGVTMSNNVQKFAPEYGLDFIKAISYNWKTPDLSAEVTKLKSLKADVIVPTGYLPDTILLARTMRELKCHANAIIGAVSGGLSNQIFAKEAGASAEYMMNGINWPNPLNPTCIALGKKYQQLTGNKLSEDVAYGYMPVFVLKDALERARSYDRTDIRNAVASTRLTEHILPSTGPIQFDTTGQNMNAGILFTQVKNGEVVSVYPQQYAQQKMILPYPKWGNRKK